MDQGWAKLHFKALRIMLVGIDVSQGHHIRDWKNLYNFHLGHGKQNGSWKITLKKSINHNESIDSRLQKWPYLYLK